MSAAPVDIALLEAEERELVLPRFEAEDAWALGVLTREIAAAAGHGVVIDVRRPQLVIFRAVLPGATPDQQAWAERKAAVTLRMESSSALVDARLSGAGVDPQSIGWLDERYAVTGGSFPIRVRGAGVVAAITVSGLSSQQDHDLAVAGLRSHLSILAGEGAAP